MGGSGGNFNFIGQTMKREVIRHGDVILIPVNQEVQKTGAKKKTTIALGEVTGHHHSCYSQNEQSGSVLVEFDEKRYLHIFGDIILKHQEHHALQIPEGVYEIKIERERDPFLNSIKKVVD